MHAAVTHKTLCSRISTAPGRAPRNVMARFRKELHPSYYETVQNCISNLEAAVKEPERLNAALADDFLLPGTEHQLIHTVEKQKYIALAKRVSESVQCARVVATAVCPSDASFTQTAYEEDLQASGFALMNLEEAGAEGGGKPLQYVGRIVVNRDGKCCLLERYRPLMGKEADVLLRDPEAYRKRMAEEVPRLEVKQVQGDQERMLEIATVIVRDIFNTGDYEGDSLGFMTDDVVMYDAHGDSPSCPWTGDAAIYRGKEKINHFAKMCHELVGTQQMLAVAASEDTNTAFVHYAMLVMGDYSMGWRNAAHRGIVALTFDDACEKVNALAVWRTFMAYERDVAFKPGVQLPLDDAETEGSQAAEAEHA